MGHSKKVLKRGDTQKSETLKIVCWTGKSAFKGKFTLLSAQKSDQKSGFAKSKKDFPHVTLVFEDGKWVEAHKMILAAPAWQKQASADIYEGNSEQGSRLVENLLIF